MDDHSAVPSAAASGGPPALAAEVLHDGRVTEDDEELILAALTECGVAAQVKIVPARRDAQTLSWLLLISLPLQGFLSSMSQKFAEDTYRTFTRVVGRLLDRYQPPAGTPAGKPPVLILQDPATGLRIALEPDLPTEAHQQLCALDLSRYRLGPLHYDRAQHRWRSELDEAESAPL